MLRHEPWADRDDRDSGKRNAGTERVAVHTGYRLGLDRGALQRVGQEELPSIHRKSVHF